MKYWLSIILCLFVFSVSKAQIQSVATLRGTLAHIKDSTEYANVLNRIGQLYFEDNVDSSFYYVIKARELSRKLSYQKGIADATNTMGVLYDMKGDLQLSLKYYSDAYNIYEKLNDRAGVIQTNMRIALVFNENHEDGKAVRTFKRAIAAGDGLQRDSMLSMALSNYLLLYPDSVSKADFLSYLKRARSIGIKYHLERIQIITDQIQAQQMIREGQMDQGIAMLKQTAAEAIRLDQNYMSLDILINLGDILLKTKFNEAAGYYKQALAISETKGYLIYIKILAKKLFDIYSVKHDLPNALQYSNKLIAVYEKEEQLNNSSGVDYIDYALKDQALTLATQKGEYRSNVIIILGFLCFAVLIIGLVIYRLLKLREKHSHILEELNKIMQKRNAELEVNHEFNNKLISILAHDFRQPIGVLKSLAGLLKDDTLSAEELREMVLSMESSSNTSLEIFENILAWIKKQLSGYVYEPKELPLHELIDESVKPFAPLIEKFNITIVNQVDPETIIYCDSELVQFVHRNFIHNAIKFSPERSTICISATRTDQEVIVKVKDEGKGISSEKIQQLFNFKQELRYSSEKEKGAGVALMICKDFITRMSGRIWAENGKDKGAVFIYSLPANNHHN